jgi:hypothetical protein
VAQAVIGIEPMQATPKATRTSKQRRGIFRR